MISSIQELVQQKLFEKGSVSNKELKFTSVGGGSINECYKITAGSQDFFCKINSATKFPQLFEKEKNGLEFLAISGKIKTPTIIDCFEGDGKQVLIMEWISEGERNAKFWKKFGEQLAALHQTTNEYFGFTEDNYMGSVVQINTACEDWVEFFIEQRLKKPVQECLNIQLLNKKHLELFENLYERIPTIFNSPQNPALLHGDLWSGNFMCNYDSEPVLIDPAVYFGHPSIDLGMTTLFGGFNKNFYEAYHYHSPLPINYEEQLKVVNLYPLLIHVLLFGRSYLSQIERILNSVY